MIYCGVDGGGTKTKIIIYDDNLLIGEATGERSSIDTVTVDISIQNIKDIIANIYESQHLTKKIDSIFLGLGGIVNIEHINNVNLAAKTIPQLNDSAVINSGNDILNAFRATCSGRENITLIIGTGSVGYGVDETGKCHRVSGFHYLEGDLGSAYDIGVRTLKMISHVFDGRLEKSPLSIYFFKQFNIHNAIDVISLFTTYKNNRTFIASFAKDVTKFSLKNDQNALRILDEASEEIINIIKAVDSNINLKNREIGIVGSLGVAEPYKSIIVSKIKNYDATFYVHESELDPAFGSIIEAKIQVKSNLFN